MTTTLTRRPTTLDLDYEAAARSFSVFLERYVYVLDPPPGRGNTKYEPWPHLSDLSEVLGAENLLIVLKARQVGVSWLLAAYACWTALFRKGANVLVLSKGEHEAQEFLGKCKHVLDHLPGWLTPRRDVDSRSQMTFPDLQSKITALAATEHAGRSETATLVIQDEADFHEYLEANYGAFGPTIDAGGQLVMVSTSDKTKATSFFKRMYRDAPGNGFAKRFMPWTVRPGRDEAWRVGVSLRYEDYQLEGEYPATEEEALRPPQIRMYFNADAVSSMSEDIIDPRETQKGGAVRIWKKPVVAGRYVAGGDFAWGEQGAYDVLMVFDWQTGEQVAEVYGRLDDDEMAQESVNLLTEYNRAWFAGERNGEGRHVIDKMVDLGYGDRMYHTADDWRENEQHRGWLTSPQTRPVLLREYEEAVRNRSVVLRCREAVSEHSTFIRNDKGRPQAQEGAHDDHVMCSAIGWQARKSARFIDRSMKPIRIERAW